MRELQSGDVLESLKRAKEVATEPFRQPRGLSVPALPPPIELVSTPGVADSAERAAQRARLIAVLRNQQEELPVVVANEAFRGLVVGGLTGLGFLLLKNLFSAGASTGETEEQYDDGQYVE